MIEILSEVGNGVIAHPLSKTDNQSTSFTAQNLPSQLLNTAHSTGLGIATTAIFEGQVDITDPTTLAKVVQEYTGAIIDYENASQKERSAALADLVRHVAAEKDWLAGWTCLSKAAPSCGLWSRLIEDVSMSVDVYRRVKLNDTARPMVDGLTIHVVAQPDPNSLNQIGPKSLGGHDWKVDKVFDEVKNNWTSSGFGAVAPCTLFGWAGLFRKVVKPEDISQMISMQLLGTVDYDFDKNEDHKPGMSRSGIVAGRNCIKTGSKLQGGAMVALLNHDLQHCVRDIQLSWAREGYGATIVGPSNISPRDWTMALSGDCAALTPYGYIPEADYDPSQPGQFTSVLVANIHDVLYDHGASNRMSGMMYTAGAGLAKDDIAVAYSIGMLDAIARRIRELPDGNDLLFGDSVYMITFSWAPFNTRYRTWERFIKYTRLLQASSSPEASRILDLSRRGKVLAVSDSDLEVIPVRDSWTAAMDKSSPSRLSPRVTQAYRLAPTSAVFDKHGMRPAGLCSQCEPLYHTSIGRENHIHAISGMPQTVIERDSVNIAAGIRRVAALAAKKSDLSGSACCEKCACKLGAWADRVAYKVLLAMMASEPSSSPQEWMLENYLVICATLWPVSVITILSGFDLVANAKFEPGAMGERDAVDC
ncbi:hypothetical protein ASPVEDRAFT_32222 [Aspergillus versicolor CBS 583.65]|uniref:Uncharacterized protein n=1 Tax=Aspergillus versicolor CBS 583.65 TaxID=1036611 RepID=A0A1L9PWJ1_ASPVE|nr:uncharacterized protein ASPVEDRAFT_32222 [Aspergillus versicolor CBS 583.65]OJJ05877.1 hypothetical protein ASPVEDRAFT_32222 [Aspergillus versicolor CBS 583.65]